LDSFGKELVKAIDGGGAKLSGIKIEEWKMDEQSRGSSNI
jgi:hypothetical protein